MEQQPQPNELENLPDENILELLTYHRLAIDALWAERKRRMMLSVDDIVNPPNLEEIK